MSTIRQTIDINLPDNNTQLITPAVLRSVLGQILDYVEGGYGNVVEFILDANGSNPLPANKLLVVIMVKPTSPIANLKIGLTAGAADVYEMNDVPAGAWTVITVNFIQNTAVTLYFTGVNPQTTFRLIKN